MLEGIRFFGELNYCFIREQYSQMNKFTPKKHFMRHQFFILTIIAAVNLNIHNSVYGQDKPQKEYVFQTFKDTRVINTYSIETLQKGVMDIRITHRFGDFINQGSFENAWTTFFGFENAADVAFGLEYGITNNFMIGVHRNKGAGPLKSLITLIAKYKLLAQTTDNKMPLSMSLAGSCSVSTMWQSTNTQSLSSFPGGFAHRMVYSLQLHMARKFGNVLSMQISPTIVWRNLVEFNDNNALGSVSVCAKIQVTKVLGILLDANLPFDKLRWTPGSGYYIPLGIGFELDTGGHIFQINLTNSAGIEPTDYIPNTTLNWAEGQFRIGFTISRAFRM
jgi:hypothetical protein